MRTKYYSKLREKALHYSHEESNSHISYLFVFTSRSIHPLVLLCKSQKNSCDMLQTPAQAFSCKFCEIKNTYFLEEVRTVTCKLWIYMFFFVLILRQNRYFLFNSDHLGNQRATLRYGSQLSKIFFFKVKFFWSKTLL